MFVGNVLLTGYVKQKQYSAQSGIENLAVVPISKVQARLSLLPLGCAEVLVALA